jgi:pimeloyl-ACP methyl ester carboxylesterase
LTDPVPVPHTVTGAGRAVGVYEYGDPTGKPVMGFHGVPACGAGFAWADAPARDRGLRLIAPDRPGVGLSDLTGASRVADYPAPVAALADTLGVDRFAVWGYSGGGPYAVACAALLPARVTKTVISAGMGEVGTWASVDDFAKTDRQMLASAATHPTRTRFTLWITARAARLSPATALKSFEKELNASDAEVARGLGEPKEAMALFLNAFLRGARGVVLDYQVIGRPWDVDLGAIPGRVVIFHGDDDTMVPLRHGRELAARIPEAELVVWPGAGHLGTVAHVDEILEALV